MMAITQGKRYQAIVDDIVEGIRVGAFRPGGLLPSERALASRYSVGRGTIREAIRVLEHSGVIEVRTGTGTLVTEEALSQSVILRAKAAILGEFSPLDIIMTRLMIEPYCASYAAENRHQHDLQVLRTTLEEHERLWKAGQNPEQIDLTFHLLLSSATHNPVTTSIVQRLVDVMNQRSWRELKHQSRNREGEQERILSQHRAIFSAVEAREPEMASDCMREHLESIRSGLLAEVS
jgi:GntR family transcriptional repressor for pyruvate dehydrogenase complex